MEDPTTNRTSDMLGELLDRMEGAQEAANGTAQEYLEQRAMAEAVRSAADMVSMACEVEAYDEREEDE
jgi:hypothetical protein